MERDPPLAGARPAAHGGERAAVADGSHRELILDGAVGETVDAVRGNRADLGGDVVPTANDDVSPKVTNQRFGLGLDERLSDIAPRVQGMTRRLAKD